MHKFSAVILAAGEGKRMKTNKPKVLQTILFKPMIDWVTDAAVSAGAEEICVVAGYEAQKLIEHLGGRFETVIQQEQLGTGHAVKQAAEFIIRHSGEDILILCGDAPLIGVKAIRDSGEEHSRCGNALTVISAEVDEPFGYGRVKRDEKGAVAGIVEEKDARPEERLLKEINSGAYWFRADALAAALEELRNDNKQGEYYLTDTVEILYNKGLKTGCFTLHDERLILGANDRHQIMQLDTCARSMIFERLFDAGVSIPCTDGVIVGPDVQVGRDTTLLPGTIIRGKTTIGEGCIVGPNSLIDNSELGNGVVFNASQAYSSRIGNGVTIGPFSQLRPNSVLADGVHVGDFVEVKNSNIGELTKVSHLTYVGDSDVGSRVNFGCGSVTVNYDGLNKYRTKIGDHAFIGCNTNLIAPVELGDNAFTAAGSTITKNVPAGSLAVARARQEILEGWVEHRKNPRASRDKEPLRGET